MKTSLTTIFSLSIAAILIIAIPPAPSLADDSEDEQATESADERDENAAPIAAAAGQKPQVNKTATHSPEEIAKALQSCEQAINKFKEMGVGVAPFESVTAQAHGLLEANQIGEAEELTFALKHSLEDQQRRFYANKIQVWHNQVKLQQEEMKKKKGHNLVSASSPSTKSGGNLAKGAHGVLSRADAKYTPLIYPIAR